MGLERRVARCKVMTADCLFGRRPSVCPHSTRSTNDGWPASHHQVLWVIVSTSRSAALPKAGSPKASETRCAVMDTDPITTSAAVFVEAAGTGSSEECSSCEIIHGRP